MKRPDVDQIVEALALASTGDGHARVEVDPEALDDPLALIGNAINLLLDDLAYRQQEREEALRQVAAVEAKQEFLSRLSHDMQTPLAMLLGTLDLLDVSDSADDLEATLPLMRQAVTTLQRFAQQFLDLAYLETDRPLAVELVPVDPLELVRRVACAFADRAPVPLEAPAEVPMILADPLRVEHIVTNLLGNAFRYARSPRIVVAVDDGDGMVEITVADRGRGIAATDLRDVFGRFDRGSVSPQGAGTGLGLFISRALAEAQGGMLTGESTPGQGSRFTLRLPIHETSPSPESPPDVDVP